MTDGRGITVNSVFDAAGQLTSRVSPNETQSFVYDPAGRRVEMSDASGTTTYTFDPAGRVTEIASPAGTVSYGWNAAGDQTLMGRADALVATSYDTNGFVAETADWAGDTIAYVNDPDGRITSTTYANGVVSTNSFDAAGRLDRIDHNLAVGALFFDYTLDANGNRVAVDTIDGTESYTLDALNRLTNATYADGTSEVFGYDAAGNRTSHTDRDGDTVTCTLDQTGALVVDSDGVVYATDNAGNLVSSSVGAAYVWDDHGRLVEATIDGVTDTAGWNANGDRVELNDAALTLDESGLATVTDNEIDAFLHGEEGISREGDTWVLTDAVGSVRATVNAAGELVDTIGYTAFGQPLDPGSTTFGFAGEHTDPTGLVHLRARPYDPGTGRFLAMDPVQPGSPGTTGWQHYAYAGNNPSTWGDPTGTPAALSHRELLVIGFTVATGALALGMALAQQQEAIQRAIDATEAEINEQFRDLINRNYPDGDPEERNNPKPGPGPGPGPDSCALDYLAARSILSAQSTALAQNPPGGDIRAGRAYGAITWCVDGNNFGLAFTVSGKGERNGFIGLVPDPQFAAETTSRQYDVERKLLEWVS